MVGGVEGRGSAPGAATGAALVPEVAGGPSAVVVGDSKATAGLAERDDWVSVRVMASARSRVVSTHKSPSAQSTMPATVGRLRVRRNVTTHS
jgi:hypothetical protein